MSPYGHVHALSSQCIGVVLDCGSLVEATSLVDADEDDDEEDEVGVPEGNILGSHTGGSIPGPLN